MFLHFFVLDRMFWSNWTWLFNSMSIKYNCFGYHWKKTPHRNVYEKHKLCKKCLGCPVLSSLSFKVECIYCSILFTLESTFFIIFKFFKSLIKKSKILIFDGSQFIFKKYERSNYGSIIRNNLLTKLLTSGKNFILSYFLKKVW